MIGSEMVAITCGLGCAVTWGAADFSGGFATRKTDVLTVLLISQLFGVTLLACLAVVFREPVPAAGVLVIGAAAGLCGAFGIVALYRGLAGGCMGIVAPVSAVVTALLPVLAALLIETNPPEKTQAIGFGLGFFAVWLMSGSASGEGFRITGLALPVAAGTGFGLFFILISLAGSDAVLWPLISARATTITLAALVFFGRRKPCMPEAGHLPAIALAGIFDTAGNAFFILAAQAGRLDISAVLGAFYPAATIGLAWALLGERLGRRQWMGVIAALSALRLIAV